MLIFVLSNNQKFTEKSLGWIRTHDCCIARSDLLNIQCLVYIGVGLKQIKFVIPMQKITSIKNSYAKKHIQVRKT